MECDDDFDDNDVKPPTSKKPLHQRTSDDEAEMMSEESAVFKSEFFSNEMNE